MNKSGSNSTIQHEGIVKKVDGNSVLVSIISSTACSGCHAEGLCGLSGREEKIVDIKGKYNVSTGDSVTVLMNESMGFKAVILSYLLPFVILVVSLILLTTFSVPELAAGLISIGILAPYFIILYFFRKRINESFIFTLKT
jgi:sigma-E factor negative regulatory protein RseC